MITDLKELSPVQKQGYLQRILRSRSVCQYTVDAAGMSDLSPFSFQYVFQQSADSDLFTCPPRTRLTTNIPCTMYREVPEVVINIVDHAMVQQIQPGQL